MPKSKHYVQLSTESLCQSYAICVSGFKIKTFSDVRESLGWVNTPVNIPA